MPPRRRSATATPTLPEIPVEWWPIEKLKLDPKNARVHDSVNLAAVKASLTRFGQRKPVVVSKDGTLVAGNGTYTVAKELAWDGLWATTFPGTPSEARAYAIADNRTSDLSSWDNGQLLDTLAALPAPLLDATGFNADQLDALRELAAAGAGNGAGGALARAVLAERFGVPPFTVLDARQGAWRERKRAWLALGIESELGRDPKLLGGGLGRVGEGGMADQLARPTKVRSGAYGAQARTGTDGKLRYETTTGATSIFDPVLCELVYRWYSGPDALVVDPWAGGSVRGIVASHLGRHYTGVELRPEQVAANEHQRGIAGAGSVHWLAGESTARLGEMDEGSADLIFGCPPYYNLEQYSDDPRDLSTMKPAAFDEAMHANVAAAARVLRDDRFAVFVVGNVREPSGRLLDMRRLMVSAGEQCGLVLYNDAILVTAVGSLPVRAGKAFQASRVLGRTHQEVLVFVKGNRKRATAACGQVDVEVTLDALAAVPTDDDL